MDDETFLKYDVALTARGDVEKWRAIRGNDPNVTSVDISTGWSSPDRPHDYKMYWLGMEALRCNTFVTKICIDFLFLRDNVDMDPILRMIRNRRELLARFAPRSFE